MFDYLLKFNKLPEELKAKINSPSAVSGLEKIEKKYNLSLATVIMRVMVKDIPFNDLIIFIAEEFGIDRNVAHDLVHELKEDVFFGLEDYLGFERVGLVKGRKGSNGIKGNLDEGRKGIKGMKGEEKDKSELKSILSVGEKFSTPSPALPSPASIPSLPPSSVYNPAISTPSSPSTLSTPLNNTPATVSDLNKLAAGMERKIVPAENSNFYFSHEDENEIRELGKKIETLNPTLQAEEIEKKLNNVLDTLKLNFGSETLLDRFKQILRTYIKGIRNRIDTKASLKKPFDQGGLGFDEDSISQVLDLTDKIAKENNASVMEKPKKFPVVEDMSALKNIGLRDVDYDFSEVIKKKEEEKKAEKEAMTEAEEKKKEAFKAHIETVKEEAAKTERNDGLEGNVRNEGDDGSDKKESALGKIFGKKKIEAAENKDENAIINGTVDARLRNESGGKIKMMDIKIEPKETREMPKTMTLVDELRYMDITNFRRLGQNDLLRSISKIKEKIKLLENESYSKKIEGVAAWRLSPANLLYLEIGSESISQNLPVDVIMIERKNSGQEFLTNDEFEAIMDLNKELRY